VDDERIQLVGEGTGAVRNLPLDGDLAIFILLPDVDGDVAALRQSVDRVAGESGFHPDGAGRRKLGVGRDGQFHGSPSKKAPPPDLLVLFFVSISLSVYRTAAAS